MRVDEDLFDRFTFRSLLDGVRVEHPRAQLRQGVLHLERVGARAQLRPLQQRVEHARVHRPENAIAQGMVSMECSQYDSAGRL
jgi:hypothetical protein